MPDISKLQVQQVKPRRLNAREWVLLRALFAKEFPGREELLGQLESAMVVGECTCGCQSVILEADRSLPPYRFGHHVPVNMDIFSPGKVPILVLLRVVDGFIVEFEILRADSLPLEGEIDLENATINLHRAGLEP